MNDFRIQWAEIRESALAAMEQVACSGNYVLGRLVQAFEQRLASYWGILHVTGVASGLDAIEICLWVLGCSPGDRVLTTPICHAWNGGHRGVGRFASAYLDGMRNPDARTFAGREGLEFNWHLFPVWVSPAPREGFQDHLNSAGIGNSIHYPTAIPDQPAFANVPFELADDCVKARIHCQGDVSLPIHPYLTAEAASQVIHAVNKWRPARFPALALAPVAGRPSCDGRGLKHGNRLNGYASACRPSHEGLGLKQGSRCERVRKQASLLPVELARAWKWEKASTMRLLGGCCRFCVSDAGFGSGIDG